MAVSGGLLQVVGTPIGNLSDMSERARDALATADIVACEDTRRCGQLYRLLGLKAPKLVSCYKENERGRIAAVVAELRAGKHVVLVSDGGMPGISDPGAALVRAVREAGGRVEVVPGPSAVAAAVAGSGFEGPFFFIGFPERKAAALRRDAASWRQLSATLVFYESPQRVAATVEILREVLGARSAWLARELTKMHEEWIGPDLDGIAAELAKRGDVKGECVLVVEGFTGEAEREAVSDKEIRARLKSGEGVKAVAAWVAEREGGGKTAAYGRVNALKNGLSD